MFTKRDAKKERLTWTDLGGHAPRDLRNLMSAILASIGIFAVLGLLMYQEWLSPSVCAVLGAAWTLAAFSGAVLRRMTRGDTASESNRLAAVLRDDHTWAGILCSLAVFMMYYFY